jgi:uncharacterized protein DUF6188
MSPDAADVILRDRLRWRRMTETYDFLIGEPVNQVWVWGPIRLVVESERRSSYVDLLHVSFTDRTGGVSEIDATRRPREAGPLLDLISQTINQAESSTEGVLLLRFDDGSQLQAYPNDRYESWSVVGEGRTVQCLPGGEITSW